MRTAAVILTFLATALTTTLPAEAFQCTVCHSKNPKMVAMHKAVQGQDCFICHNVGDKLMGKGQPKDRESLMKRRATDTVCLKCHQTK
jgi:ribosomal protein L40E